MATDIFVTYAPTIPNSYSCTHFEVLVDGGNNLKFTCLGEGLGNNVYMSATSLQFGEVGQDQTTNRLLNIVNDSDQPTSFQIFSDKSNIFAFSKTEGVIKPKSQARIIIEFFPQKTTSYYERVFCVVRNHQVLFVDLVGTCYDVLNKPMPLMQRHVDIYRHKVIMGLHNRQRRERGNTQLNKEDLSSNDN
jgi:hypothetical protein